jgi:hypothetical protein
MMIKRRNLLQSMLFGTGYVGLRALATGIPAAVLMKGRRALADVGTCPDKTKAQYVIFSTSGSGDPINTNAPGTYGPSNIVHAIPPATLALGNNTYQAGQPWTSLAPTTLARTTFFHIATETPVHPKQPDVMKLLDATSPAEMLPSLLAKQLQPCLGTIQAQPITVGALSPSEGLSFAGQALPILPPLALKATLTGTGSPLAGLTSLRDQTLAQLDGVYRNRATRAQRAYLDALVTSQQQVRNIKTDLLALLGNITDNQIGSQILAALALIQMNVTPVVAIRIPFGGDNHNDVGLATEVAQTTSGIAAISSLMSQIPADYADQISFLSLNVFGRTLGPGNNSGNGGMDGRQHNPNHQVSIAIGKPFQPGVIGGIGPIGGDYGAVAFDSGTGVPGGGDIQPPDSLASFGKTCLAAVGVDAGFIDANINSGKVIQAALKP